MTQKKILFLSVSAGAGHTRAAEALRGCAALQHPAVAAIHLDVMNFVSPGLRKLYTDFYIFLVNKAPALWAHVYRITNQARADGWLQRLRRRAEWLNCQPLLREIAALDPDAIVCTHFLPAELMSQLAASGRLHCPVWVQVTDFDVHRMWLHQGMAGYFAASDEVAFRMRELGIAAAAIHVSGIPIMPAFAQAPERRACAAEFGLDPDRTTLLLMGGGAGLGQLTAIAERLLALPEDFQLIVLAGHNQRALAALQALAARHPGRLWPQGFTERVERLMACADLLITKPGGLTSAESLAMAVPMIVSAPIPGQEERNADFLLEHGVALKAVDAVALEYRIRHLLAHPAQLGAMRARASALARPHAACQVLATVLAHTER